MASKTISVLGGLDYDLIMLANRIPDSGESLPAIQYLEALGGKGANAAIATCRACRKQPTLPTNAQKPATPVDEARSDTLSAKSDSDSPQIEVKMVGAVGDDNYGQRFYGELARNGIDVSGIVTVPNCQTSICFVMVEDYTRENRCLFTLGATASWRREDFKKPEQLGHGMKPDLCVAQMEIDKGVVEQMIETAGKAKIDFVLNAAPAYPIDKGVYRWITHLLVNDSEAATMSGKDLAEVNSDSWDSICQEFLDLGVENVVITLGSKGAYYANAEQRGRAVAYQVDVVDTTGAGCVHLVQAQSPMP